MKNSILIPLLLAAAVACTTLQAAAADLPPNAEPAAEEGLGNDPGGAGWERERPFERMAEVLDLTAEQREQIGVIRKTEREKVAPLLKQLREGREKLHALIEAEPFDEAAVRALAAAQADIRTELIVSRARTQNKIQSLLTPEQRELAEKLRPMMKRRGHRR